MSKKGSFQFFENWGRDSVQHLKPKVERGSLKINTSIEKFISHFIINENRLPSVREGSLFS